MVFRNIRIDPFGDAILRHCFLPLLLFGGLAVAVVGGYYSWQKQAECRRLAEEHGYVEGYIVPNRYGPDQCVCRGRLNGEGELDMTISTSFPLR